MGFGESAVGGYTRYGYGLFVIFVYVGEDELGSLQISGSVLPVCLVSGGGVGIENVKKFKIAPLKCKMVPLWCLRTELVYSVKTCGKRMV